MSRGRIFLFSHLIIYEFALKQIVRLHFRAMLQCIEGASPFPHSPRSRWSLRLSFFGRGQPPSLPLPFLPRHGTWPLGTAEKDPVGHHEPPRRGQGGGSARPLHEPVRTAENTPFLLLLAFRNILPLSLASFYRSEVFGREII